ncbi:NUDIX domain-containing protein [Spongisporangium articulatum]|uniref:NUDIX domain-containing protein n=1 Tax=Spongisporangium articulatum TaxID=3362603 RepID=A0ABW8AKL4_9ACTN
MGRVQFFDGSGDEPSPPPGSFRVGASALVLDDAGRVLLQQRRDNGLWALPGGAVDPGESVGAAAAREACEETGYDVEPLYVVGVYSDPRHVFVYPGGEARQEFVVCVACRLVGGALAVSEESREVGWFTPSELEALTMHPRVRARIEDHLAGRRALLG